LRYYAGLPESEIAAAMGISRGAVQSHTARGCPCFARLSNRPTRNPPIPATATRAVSARCRPRRRSGPRSRSGR
jgi:hypothetical protein